MRRRNEGSRSFHNDCAAQETVDDGFEEKWIRDFKMTSGTFFSVQLVAI